jgi:hypothetical protein
MRDVSYTPEGTRKMYEYFTAIENHIKEIESIKIAKLYQKLFEKGVKKAKHDFNQIQARNP